MKNIKEAIEYLANRIKEGVTSDDALSFSQAALNLANCEAQMKITK